MNKKYSFLDKYMPDADSHFDMQRFGDPETPPPAGTPETDTPPAEEFETYNGFKVPKGAVDAINKRVATETHTLKEKLKKFEEENNSFRVQFEEFKLSQMSEKEKQEHAEEKRKEREAELLNKANDKDRKFKNYFLDTELFREIGNYDVINSKQVLSLIKAEYKEEFEEAEEDVNIFFKKGSAKLTVQEAVKSFLSDPSNSNLIRSSLKPGAGTKVAGNQQKNLRTIFKRSEVADVNSDAAKEYNEAMKAGLRPTLTD
jgi:hypothetical protein